MPDEIIVELGSLVPDIVVEQDTTVQETDVTNSQVGLKGDEGDPGPEGPEGPQGDPGPQGPPGDDAFNTDLDITVLFENALL